MRFIASTQPICKFLDVRPFELRAPDYDDIDVEPPTFPNALAVCRCKEPCRYEVVTSPQPWHPWDPQWTCAGWHVVYADQERTAWTVEQGLWWPNDPPLRPVPPPTEDEQLELLRHWFLPPQHRETFRQSETAWGYDGAVKYLAKLLAHKRTPTYSLHFPEAIAHRSMLRIWFIGHNSPGHPDREIPLDDFIRETLPPAPPAGEQLRLF